MVQISLTNQTGSNTNYLFDKNHCLYFFIVSLVFYIIYTYFRYLMPDISLPSEIQIRSIWGYAFLGEITELERLNVMNRDIWDTPSKDDEHLGSFSWEYGSELTQLLPAMFALANKQYETLKWIESKGAKQHIWLFVNRSDQDKKDFKTMGFEWARKMIRAYNGAHKYQW